MQKAYYSNKDELYWQPLIADNSPEMDFGNIPLNKRNILEDLYIHFVKRYGPAYAALAHAEDLSGRMNDWYVIYIQQTGDELRMMHNSNTLDLFWQKCLESLELRTTNSKGKLKKNLSATLEVISMALRELSKIRTGKKFRKAYRLAENEFLENGRPFTWQQLEKAANNISSRNGLDEFAETYSKEIASVFGQISKRL